MTYKLTFRDLDLPRKCPVCQEGRKDAAAIAVHNTKAAADGCRSYEAVKR